MIILNSKKSKIILYSLAVLIFIALFVGQYFKDKIYSDTIDNGVTTKVKIFNVICTNGKGQSNLWFKDANQIVHHVNLNYIECSKYKIGDSVLLLDNPYSDFYILSSN